MTTTTEVRAMNKAEIIAKLESPRYGIRRFAKSLAALVTLSAPSVRSLSEAGASQLHPSEQ